MVFIFATLCIDGSFAKLKPSQTFPNLQYTYQVVTLEFKMFFFILANSADPVAYYLGLHCLSKYPFKGFQLQTLRFKNTINS